MIEAKACGAGDEGNSSAALGWDEGCAFFGGSVGVGGKELSVPVELLGDVGLVVDVDGDALALLEAKEWAGELAVVGGGGDDAVWGEFDGRGGDGEGVVCGRFGLVDDAGERGDARDCSGGT